MFETSLHSLLTVLDPSRLGLMFIGTVIGNIFGFLPGLSGITFLAIMIPFVYPMDTATALAFLMGGHAAVATGGSLSAILFNVPGTAVCLADCFDGHPMAKQGRAAEAIAVAATSSVLGGLFGALFMTICIPVLRPLVMLLGSPEYFMMTLIGLTVIALLGSKSFLRSLISGGIGLLLSFVGFDPVTGVVRYNFGIHYLDDGFKLIVVVIGFFAFVQMFELYCSGTNIARGKTTVEGWSGVFKGIKETLKSRVWLLGSVIGVIIGFIPGIGGTVANVLAYGQAAQWSKKRELFGTGIPEGVMAPQGSNHAKEGGALIPTLAFGIPGSESMAILLGVFMMKGIAPGPEMLTKHVDIVFILIWTLVIANLLAAIQVLLATPTLAKLTTIPSPILVPIVLVLSAIGAFSAANSMIDVLVGIGFGVVGFFLKKYNYSLPSMVIGLVLGTIVERNLQVSLRAYGPTFFITRPISIFLFVIVLILITLPFIRKRQAGSDEGSVGL